MATAVVDSSDESHSDVPSEVPSDDGESDGGDGGVDDGGKEVAPSRPKVRVRREETKRRDAKKEENILWCVVREHVCMYILSL